MADASDFNLVAVIAEDDAMVLGAKAVEWRLDALQAFYVTFVGFQKARQRAENLNRDGLRDSADVGLGLVGEGNALSHSACSSPQQAES